MEYSEFVCKASHSHRAGCADQRLPTQILFIMTNLDLRCGELGLDGLVGGRDWGNRGLPKKEKEKNCVGCDSDSVDWC